MRISALAILAAATVFATAPARAQTYNPDYPVCLQVYGIAGNYIAVTPNHKICRRPCPTINKP
jgi:hypothetical protein